MSNTEKDGGSGAPSPDAPLPTLDHLPLKIALSPILPEIVVTTVPLHV
ncbi:hypothetical protein [Kitasatospora sp. GAS1066B]